MVALGTIQFAFTSEESNVSRIASLCESVAAQINLLLDNSICTPVRTGLDSFLLPQRLFV